MKKRKKVAITKNREEYLRAIFHLFEESKKDVKAIDLTRYLKVSKASVSEMLKELLKSGLVEYKEYKKIKLTKKGIIIASNITNKHRIIENFLIKMLNKKKSSIHKEADKLEHAFSDSSIVKIRELLKYPKFCPHGKFIGKLTYKKEKIKDDS